MSDSILMAVHSPKRGGGHKGVFAGGLLWIEGTSVQEVPLDRVRDVQAKQEANMLKILAVGKDDVEKALAAEAKAAKEVAAAQAEAEKRISAAKVKLPAGVGPRGSASRLPGSSQAPHSLGQPGDEIRAEMESRARQLDDEFKKREEALKHDAEDLKKTVEAAQKRLAEQQAELDKKADELAKREEALKHEKKK